MGFEKNKTKQTQNGKLVKLFKHKAKSTNLTRGRDRKKMSESIN